MLLIVGLWINYFYLISQIFKIWYTIKRFALNQNATKTWQKFLTIYCTNKILKCIYFLKFGSLIINLQKVIAEFFFIHLFSLVSFIHSEREKTAIASPPYAEICNCLYRPKQGVFSLGPYKVMKSFALLNCNRSRGNNVERLPCINTSLHFSSRQDPNIFLGYVINEFIEQENKIPPTRNISKLDEKIPKSIKIVQVRTFF